MLCTLLALRCRGVKITQDLKKQTGPKLKDFRDFVNKEVRVGQGGVMKGGES